MKDMFLILDGLGYEQMLRFQPAALSRLGTQLGLQPLETLLAYSSGIYPAIWTGLYPDESGFWTEFVHLNSATSQRFFLDMLLPGRQFARQAAYVFDKLGLKTFRRDTGHYAIPATLRAQFSRLPVDYASLPPVRMEQEGLISRLYAQAGRRLEYLHFENLDDAAVSRIIEKARRSDTLIVCLAETDHAGHRLGPLTRQYQQFLQNLDDRLDRLFKKLDEGWPDARLFVFSDHGMTPVTCTFDLWGFLQSQGYKPGRDYTVFINSTLASFWAEGSKRKQILDLLAHSGAGRILCASERQRCHLNFSSSVYGDEIFIADEGVELIPNFISLARKPERGMHGYDPACPSTRAFFIGGNQFSGSLENVVDVYRVLQVGLTR